MDVFVCSNFARASGERSRAASSEQSKLVTTKCMVLLGELVTTSV